MSVNRKISSLGLSLLVVLSTSAFANDELPTEQIAKMPAEAQGSSTLVLTVEGIREVSGLLSIGLYNSETGHKTGQAIVGARPDVDSASVEVTFEGLAEGQYAINLFHDVDGNGEMNTNMFGIPTEPYAFSNNAKGTFGPAKWVDANFTVGADTNTHVITMFK